jgi:hypothetical protein
VPEVFFPTVLNSNFAVYFHVFKDGGSNIFKTWWEYSRSREYSYLCVEFTNDGYFLHTIVYLRCTIMHYHALFCTILYNGGSSTFFYFIC